MIENFDKIIEGSLQLKEPWYVSGAEFKEEEPAIHIYVKVRERARISCPICGEKTKRYGYETEERKWRHGDCMFYQTYVHCRRPKVLCPHCGVKQISAPFERANSRFTLMFEGYAMLLAANMPRSKVAKALRCDEKSIKKIVIYWVEKADNERNLSNTKSIAIDETSFKKGHEYVTLIIDSDQRAVIDVEPGRDKKTVETFAEKLENKGGKCDDIVSVTSDMSSAFLNAVDEKFKNAVHVIDKFHVKQMLLHALDDVRKEEQKNSKQKQALFRGRRLFMIPKNRMTDKQKSKLAELSSLYPKTGRAYRIVSAFDDMYSAKSPEEAKVLFDSLYSWMRHSRLEPMKQCAESLKKHEKKILNYFSNPVTNAICEGINSMVQSAKRRARGFHTYRGFASAIYLVAGKLKLSVTCPI